jgi:hypothetical protein
LIINIFRTFQNICVIEERLNTSKVPLIEVPLPNKGENMVYIGYRKGGVKKGYAGMRYCTECNYIAHHYVYENSFRPTVMFIAVAKFNKSYMLGCENCEKGYEIEDQSAQQLIQKSHQLPKAKVFFEIYKSIETALNEVDNETGNTWTNKLITQLLGDTTKNDEILNYLFRKLGHNYNHTEITTVFLYFVNAQLQVSSFI